MIVDNISTDTNVTRNGDQYVDSIQYFVKKEHTNLHPGSSLGINSTI